VALPLQVSAQSTPTKTKKPPKATATGAPTAAGKGATSTVGKGTTPPKQGSIEQLSFDLGASNPAQSSQPKPGAKAGQANVSQLSVGGGNKQPNVYKGPNLVVPPTGGQPNDSAHKRPPH
jgi:hypothetical protein